MSALKAGQAWWQSKSQRAMFTEDLGATIIGEVFDLTGTVSRGHNYGWVVLKLPADECGCASGKWLGLARLRTLRARRPVVWLSARTWQAHLVRISHHYRSMIMERERRRARSNLVQLIPPGMPHGGTIHYRRRGGMQAIDLLVLEQHKPGICSPSRLCGYSVLLAVR